MRDIKIFYDGEGPNSLHFEEFAREIEDEINANTEVMEQVRKCNADFADRVREALEGMRDSLYAGTTIQKVVRETPRYVYLKNRTLGERRYDVEIDLLMRRFSIREQ